MKRILTLALVGAAAIAAPLQASAVTVGATGTVTINGSVAANCQFGGTGAATITAGSTGEMADPSIGAYVPASLDGKTATLTGFCNGLNSTVDVLANPVVGNNSAGAATGFTNRVDYTATATLTNALGVGKSDADGSTLAGADTAATAIGLFSGNILITLSGSTSGGNKPVAGNYTGTTVVTLTPAL